MYLIMFTFEISTIKRPVGLGYCFYESLMMHYQLNGLFCLVQDPYWCCLVQYCVVNDSYIGCDLPSLDEHFLKVY